VTAAPDIVDVGRVPEGLWERLRAQPERAPELIALEAAEHFAPQAERWVAVAGGGHTPERLARIAYKKHVRLSRLEGAALGLGGVFTAAADLVALLWIQSRMVFFIAAAHGYDPSHPMRPAELLALQEVYPTPEEARHALDGLGKPLAHALVEKSLAGEGDRRIATRLIVFAGKRAARKAGGRLIPLIGAPIGAVQNAGATKELGRRALAYYGGPQARP
jgi:EcsC family protein